MYLAHDPVLVLGSVHVAIMLLMWMLMSTYGIVNEIDAT